MCKYFYAWLSLVSLTLGQNEAEFSGPLRENKGEKAIFPQWPGPGPNGLARTPPMGWMSWERFRCVIDCVRYPDDCIGEKLYMTMTDHIANDGYLAAGYNHVSIDDCWENHDGRDSHGRLYADEHRFPSGFKALGDYMHKKGVKFGIYSDCGTKTCGGFPGSLHHEKVDAQTFAEWGVDYLKYDGCYNNQQGYYSGYPDMGTALQASGRNITYSCSWPAYLGSDEGSKPWDAMIAAGCNLWRNWGDIDNTWKSLESIINHWGDYSSALQKNSGPGHWNDPDMVLCGDDHHGKTLSTDQCKCQMSIWSIMAAPLIMSNDLRTVTSAYKAILQNREVIAVDQDPKGQSGARISPKGDQEVWARTLGDGSVAVALLNKGSSSSAITAKFSDVGFHFTKAQVRDLWAQKDLGSSSNSITMTVPATGVVMVKLSQ